MAPFDSLNQLSIPDMLVYMFDMYVCTYVHVLCILIHVVTEVNLMNLWNNLKESNNQNFQKLYM